MSGKGTETRYDEWVHDSPYGHLHLRDLFAAFALAGMLARPVSGDDELTAEEQAADAYYYADALLAQRSKES